MKIEIVIIDGVPTIQRMRTAAPQSLQPKVERLEARVAELEAALVPVDPPPPDETPE